MIKKGVVLFLLMFFLGVQTTYAVYDPISVSNNKFGIHIMNEGDLDDASNLVNSNGGEWGYVTFVIRKDERDDKRWNRVFLNLKQLKLIPIVRIATTTNSNGIWEKPLEEDAGAWATFLNSLNWPTKNRYVILFNEPNHAKEWGGKINPSEYAQIARIYWEKLRRKSDNFFVLPAAMDEAASDTSKTMDAQEFFDGMVNTDELVFTIFDGWNSHSYPNPGFAGNPDDQGKSGISGYKWEINYLSKYGLARNIPVLISETGWVNSLGEEKISENLERAFGNIWNEQQVFAVTPFILSYSFPPFDKFSWKNPETNEFYSYYYKVMSFPKVKGQPIFPEPKRASVKSAKTILYPFLKDYLREKDKKADFFDFSGLLLD